MERLIEALEKQRELETIHLSKIKNLFSERRRLRRELQKKIGIRKVSVWNDEVSYVGVDSAFKMLKNTFGTVEYVCIAVALFGGGEEKQDVAYGEDIDAWCEVDTGEYESLLKGISIASEFSLLERYSGKFKYAFIDRSLVSVVSGVNQAVTLASRLRGRSELARLIVKNYPSLLLSLHKVLRRGGFVTVLKRSGRAELAEALGLLMTTDYELAWALLDEGEYVELPIMQYNYNLPRPSENDCRAELFKLINSCKVAYMKGLSGYVFKFEYSGALPEDAVFPQTLNKEIMVLKECDEKARSYLSLFENKLLEEYR